MWLMHSERPTLLSPKQQGVSASRRDVDSTVRPATAKDGVSPKGKQNAQQFDFDRAFENSTTTDALARLYRATVGDMLAAGFGSSGRLLAAVIRVV
jgi:hypothetical protein